ADAACWGVAMLAARGAGLADERGERREARHFSLASRLSPPSDGALVPQPDAAAYYRERMGVYRALYDALRPISHAL
ncbi:MAG TPA: hypothetical protein VFX03_09515, partial [Thermomicrobiales bacterium]|nr:hypothetical protein [Thermomicrobiales bacterium]